MAGKIILIQLKGGEEGEEEEEEILIRGDNSLII